MSKKEKPILNLQKGCPFCGDTDLTQMFSFMMLEYLKAYVHII